MAALLAGLPVTVPGATDQPPVRLGPRRGRRWRRAPSSGEAELLMAGGVESMSRAPFVMPKADAAFSRDAEFYDTTIGWRFVNPRIKERYGVDSMPETGENVAAQFSITRADQDRFALRSQQRAAAAAARGFFTGELVRGGDSRSARASRRCVVTRDEHPRPETTLEQLAALAGAVSRRRHGHRRQRLGRQRRRLCAHHRLRRRRRAAGASRRARASSPPRPPGVEPRIMGMGPRAGDAQGAGARAPQLGAARCDRAERGFRRRRRSRCCASWGFPTMPRT